MPEITRTSWLAIVILGFVWGGTFLIMKLALVGITPFWLAAGRISFAAILTTAIWLILGRKIWLDDARSWGGLATVGALSTAVPFMFLSWGQQHVTSGFAGVSMAAVALIVLPLAHFYVPSEQMTLRKTLGFLVGFAGIVLLIGAQAFESSGSELESLGRFACLCAASCYALSSVVMRRLPPIDTIGLAAVPLVFGTIFVIPIALIVEGPPQMPDTRTLMIVAFLGLVPTAAATYLRVYVIRSAGPVFMSLTNYQVPIWSVVLGAFFLSEPLPASLLLALVLILSGVALSQYGALRRLFGNS
ncbi:EamA family transporter [Lentibacter algarum]|uniref:DMT family transporter n=1 Tax=Lentibacter algarum TaxID=576131 RepID=UPI001C09BB3E|nr:EamA family transporter [Lentibacter algarum]MBU2983456.1 EamA family transporter [Lentibacter algarum]